MLGRHDRDSYGLAISARCHVRHKLFFHQILLEYRMPFRIHLIPSRSVVVYCARHNEQPSQSSARRKSLESLQRPRQFAVSTPVSQSFLAHVFGTAGNSSARTSVCAEDLLPRSPFLGRDESYIAS